MLLTNAIKRKAAWNWKKNFNTFSEKAAVSLFKALGKPQPKKICNGGGCERKHEAVNQNGKEQDFQGAANAIFKRNYLKNMEKVISLQMTEQENKERKRRNWGKRKKKRWRKKKKIAIHKASFKDDCKRLLASVARNANSSQKWNTLCSLCTGLCHTKKGFWELLWLI